MLVPAVVLVPALAFVELVACAGEDPQLTAAGVEDASTEGSVADASADTSAADASTDGTAEASTCGVPAGVPAEWASADQASLIAVDPSGVFWVEAQTRLKTRALDADAGTVALDEAPLAIRQLALSNTHAVWQAGDATVGFAAKTGPRGVTVAVPYATPRGIAVRRTDSTVFYTTPNDDNGIGVLGMDCPPDASCVVGSTTAVAIIEDALGIALDSGSLYFFGAATVGGTLKLWSCAATGCSALSELGLSSPTPQAITARAGRVAWIDTVDKSVVAFTQAVGQLWKGPTAPVALAIDETHAYFIAGDAVYAAAFAGGCVATLASGQTGARGIAVDDGAVYWTVPGAIMRRPKK